MAVDPTGWWCRAARQIEKELDETFSDRRLLVEAEALEAPRWMQLVSSLGM